MIMKNVTKVKMLAIMDEKYGDDDNCGGDDEDCDNDEDCDTE